jgi:crotonobetainyl-CoA:carnitine CoA-transferase CaiB-like acyl-CoA transferase
MTGDAGQGPLCGLRVLEYAQYVAGPFAGMLLADLGADVIKVEPPGGDAWRHYEPFAPGESRYFYALNRNKRSVVIDLKREDGRRSSRALIRTADAVLHNLPPERAHRFGLDRESVRDLNPAAVWCSVSALGSHGPDAGVTAFDLVAQALSGLLFANAHAAEEVPQRAGGIAMADFTAGLLAAVAVLAGLVARARDHSPGLEVSLLGAALAVQAQRFVSVRGLDRPVRGHDRPVGGHDRPVRGHDRPVGGHDCPGRRVDRPAREDPRGSAPLATPRALAEQSRSRRASDELEPYYRTYAAADGFFVLACLHARQRAAAAAVLGLDDPWSANPQAEPADAAEREQRLALAAEFEHRLRAAPVSEWVRRFRAAGVPAAEVRTLDGLFDHDQVRANGLVQSVPRPGVGEVDLLGSVFKIDGSVSRARRGVPDLGEHTQEVLAECRQAQQ